MNNINRKINYNYFFENTEEKFQIQSICFSYTNAVNIIKALEKINKMIKYDKNNIKEIIDYIIKNAEKYKFLFINALLNQKKEINNFIYISKIEYLPSLEARMNSILKDNFISINPPKKEKMKEEEISRFKRCLSEVLTYTNLIHREDIPTFTEIKSNKYIYDLNLIEKLLKKLEKKRYDEIMGKNSENIVEEKNIVLNPDFKSEILPKILLKIKDEIMINSYDEYLQRILYCCSYIQLHIELLPEKYILNNYKNLFIELIKDTEDNVHILRNNILNQLNIKIKDSLKTNLIISSIHNQIKNLEKLKCIQYLYNKMEFPYFFEVKYSLKGIIKSITFIEDTENLSLNKINELIPDFNKCENIENIFEFQESVNMDKALDDFFIKLKKLIKKEKIIKKYSPEETLNISYDLVDFICGIIYNKIFPKKKSKLDSKFYKKCLRLQFIKPENLVEDKNIINENLSSDNSFPKRTVLVKDRKNKYSLSKIQKTDFSIYKSCLNPKEQKKKKRASKIKYRDYWDYEDDEDYYEKKSASSKSVLDFEEPIVESRGEAEALWETMNDILNSKKQLSIAVLYALVGSRDVSHTYYKYGWKHLPEKPSIIKVKEGFWIKLPRPIPLD